ncbi:hypothetical protein DFJ73DRAFT_28669 [Zopfochytrium polystomum]|nr:hypothetical protein DFJ73DRAFT_28669 [Zopfochytrium polystomum]
MNERNSSSSSSSTSSNTTAAAAAATAAYGTLDDGHDRVKCNDENTQPQQRHHHHHHDNHHRQHHEHHHHHERKQARNDPSADCLSPSESLAPNGDGPDADDQGEEGEEGGEGDGRDNGTRRFATVAIANGKLIQPTKSSARRPLSIVTAVSALASSNGSSPTTATSRYYSAAGKSFTASLRAGESVICDGAVDSDAVDTADGSLSEKDCYFDPPVSEVELVWKETLVITESPTEDSVDLDGRLSSCDRLDPVKSNNLSINSPAVNMIVDDHNAADVPPLNLPSPPVVFESIDRFEMAGRDGGMAAMNVCPSCSGTGYLPNDSPCFNCPGPSLLLGNNDRAVFHSEMSDFKSYAPSLAFTRLRRHAREQLHTARLNSGESILSLRRTPSELELLPPPSPPLFADDTGAEGTDGDDELDKGDVAALSTPLAKFKTPRRRLSSQTTSSLKMTAILRAASAGSEARRNSSPAAASTAPSTSGSKVQVSLSMSPRSRTKFWASVSPDFGAEDSPTLRILSGSETTSGYRCGGATGSGGGPGRGGGGGGQDELGPKKDELSGHTDESLITKDSDARSSVSVTVRAATSASPSARGAVEAGSSVSYCYCSTSSSTTSSSTCSSSSCSSPRLSRI